MPRKKSQQILKLRRYAGCRLYDPDSRTYVSADEVERLRMEGWRVAIRDVETGQDVTEACLVRRTH